MQAAVFEVETGELRFEDVPVPEPGPNEVRVKVAACGVCLSDVHLIDGSMAGSLPRIIPGHEAAGVIDALGSQVPGWQVGQRVVMTGGRPCGRCGPCIRGRSEECRAFEIMGFGFNGAWAEYVVVPYRSLCEVPDEIPLEQAAILADAVSTPYAALADRAQLRAGESIGLWGIGGLGTHAVQLARLLGAAPVIALDPLPSARERALAVGADIALDPLSPDLRKQILELTDGAGLDVAVDLVGANAVLAQGLKCLGRFGRLVMVGLSQEPVKLGPGVLMGVQSQSLLGHLGYHKHHLDELVGLVARGRLDVSGSISEILPLSAVNEAVRRLATKEGDPIRLVLAP